MVLVSIGIGLGLLLIYCVDYYIQEMHFQNVLGGSRAEKYKRSIGFGFWGTILGFVVAAVGMFLSRRKHRDTQVEIPTESG